MTRYIDAVLREDAMEWLLNNYEEFPAKVKSECAPGISKPVFGNWRWVYTPLCGILLANCLQPGISREDFYRRKEGAQ